VLISALVMVLETCYGMLEIVGSTVSTTTTSLLLDDAKVEEGAGQLLSVVQYSCSVNCECNF